MNPNKWEKIAKVPEYDPPQLRKGWLNTCYCVNWYGIRSPWCKCCVNTTKCCMCTQSIHFNDEKTWIYPLMKSLNPKCPEELQGIYWLRDHIQPTTLLTFHDCDWSDNKKTARSLGSNWIKSDTLYGVLSSFSFYIGKCCFDMPVHFSSNGKWILVNFAGLRVYWLYVFQKEMKLVRKYDGQIINVLKGDLMRIDYEKWDDPNSKIKYIYILQKIIIPGPNNTFKKTQGYNEFIKRVNTINKEPFFRKNSLINHSTIMEKQHTLSFSPEYMERN